MAALGILKLACYDSQVHNDGDVTFAGTTNADTDHYRWITSSENCSVLFGDIANSPDGKLSSTGSRFVYSDAGRRGFYGLEDHYIRFEKLSYSKSSNNSYGTVSAVGTIGCTFAKIIFCIVYDCINGGSGWTFGIVMDGGGGVIYGCISYNTSSTAIAVGASMGPESVVACCTAVPITNNGGFSGSNPAVGGFWSCHSESTYAAYPPGYDADPRGGWNSAEDGSADEGGGGMARPYKNSNQLIAEGKLDGTNYLPTQSISWDAGANEQAGKSPIDGLSSTWNPDNFFTTYPDILKDITGRSRPAATDAAWDVGAGQYPVGNPWYHNHQQAA